MYSYFSGACALTNWFLRQLSPLRPPTLTVAPSPSTYLQLSPFRPLRLTVTSGITLTKNLYPRTFPPHVGGWYRVTESIEPWSSNSCFRRRQKWKKETNNRCHFNVFHSSRDYYKNNIHITGTSLFLSSSDNIEGKNIKYARLSGIVTDYF